MSTDIKTWNTAVDNIDDENRSELMKKLPSLLRILGTIALLVAMYSFLVKGWGSGGDVFRYLLMLGHTGALATIGLASGHWLKEGKGARLLLTLALVSVTANFAILGAFIFSQTQVASTLYYPGYVAWSVDSLSTALIITGIAMLVLLPVVLLGFRVLSRSMSSKLAALYLISNAALLIPLRDAHMVGYMVIGLSVLVLIFSRKAAQKNISAKTHEGTMALVLQYVPVAVLLGRNIWLYSPGLFLLTVLALTVFFALRQISIRLDSSPQIRSLVELMSVLPALGSGAGLGATLAENGFLATELLLPIAALATASLIYEISLRAQQGVTLYRTLSVVVLCFGLLSNMLLFGGVLAAMMSTVIGIMVAIYGYMKQQRIAFGGGMVTMSVGLIYQLYYAIQIFNLGSWASLAMLGMAAIVVGSTIESHGCRIKLMLTAWRAKYGDWDY
jgi:hypothetical protein